MPDGERGRGRGVAALARALRRCGVAALRRDSQGCERVALARDVRARRARVGEEVRGGRLAACTQRQRSGSKQRERSYRRGNWFCSTANSTNERTHGSLRLARQHHHPRRNCAQAVARFARTRALIHCANGWPPASSVSFSLPHRLAGPRSRLADRRHRCARCPLPQAPVKRRIRPSWRSFPGAATRERR